MSLPLRCASAGPETSGCDASTYGTRRPSGLTANVPTRISGPTRWRESRKLNTSRYEDVSLKLERSGRVVWAASGARARKTTRTPLTHAHPACRNQDPGCNDIGIAILDGEG